MIQPGESFAHIVTLENDPAKFLDNTIEAAALYTCGVPIRTFKTPREKTGEVEWKFDYPPGFRVPLRIASEAAVKINGMEIPVAALSANQLMHVYRDGSLDRIVPAHPFLDAIRALRNRERFLRWILKGHPCGLKKHPRCDRWQYESAPLVELPSQMIVKDDPPTTRELKTVCALGVFGVPAVRCFGVLPDMTFELAGVGFAGDTTPPQSPQLAIDFNSGAMEESDPHHPYFIAHAAVAAIQTLKIHMCNEIANVWIEKRNSRDNMSGFVRADATSKARDQLRAHFRRGD